MKTLNTKEILKSLDGKELVEGETKITVGLLISNALSNTDSINPHRAYQLAKIIASETKVDLKAEDIVFIKETLSKSRLIPLYIGQTIEILESK